MKNTVRILLGLGMIYAGVAHLTFARKKFRALVPKSLPQDEKSLDFVVVASGWVEIGLGLAMIGNKRNRAETGLLVATFLLMVFPGNLSQYRHRINAFGLNTDRKRRTRLYIQPLLIGLTLWSMDSMKTGTHQLSISE